MGLKIIYGRSGTGKSTYYFNLIKNQVNTNSKSYIITPEQFSFTVERRLLDVIGKEAITSAEVLTFDRMAYRLMNEVSGATKINLSTPGKAMIVYDILSNNKNNLKFLGKSEENVDMILTQLTEFKKHNISIDMIDDFINDTSDIYLQKKMQDIQIIYKAFESTIQNRFIDENDKLTILQNNLKKIDLFKGSTIYIDEFVGFTPQEYEIIRELLKRANEVNVIINSDEIHCIKERELDIFYSSKETIKKLINIANEENVEVEELKLTESFRYKNDELKHLEKNIFDIPYKKYDKELNNIELFLAKNPYSEIENVAKQISILVKNENYKYKDIAVITKNIDEYSNLCKVIFNKYDIPIFIDEKKDLSQNILVKYILAIIDVFAKSWSYEAVFNYLKTGLVDVEEDEIYEIEDYCLKWGIKGSKWYNGEWNYEQETNNNVDALKKIYEVRDKIVKPLMNFKEKVLLSKDAKTITKGLFEFLIENEIDKKIYNKVQELNNMGKIEIAKEYEISWNVICDVFDEIVLIFNEQKMSFDKYMQILRVGLKNSELGKIPATQDEVIMGDVDRSRSHKVKTVFIIGLNDGKFPSINKGEGFFNDNDRKKLKDNYIEIAKGTMERLYEDNFNIYKAFSSAEEKLYLSYCSSDIEGKSLRASILITKLKKIFIKLKEKSNILFDDNCIINENSTFEELLNKLSLLNAGEEILPIWYAVYRYFENSQKWKDRLNFALEALNYTNIPKKINSESINKLYGDVLHTTVSRLENYQACPFSYYLKYGLKIDKFSNLKIESIDTGSFMHEVIDGFFEEIKDIDIQKLEDEELKKIVNNIVNEKLSLIKNYKFTMTSKFKALTNKLKRVIFKSVKYIVEGLKNSDFKVLGHEVEFGKDKDYDTIKLDLDNNKKFEITGKIDRLDIANGEYIRIIDYKSSNKNIDLNDVIAGLQLQLLTYLGAVCKNQKEIKPAAVLYFNLTDPVVKNNKNMTDEEIELEIQKSFKMNGLILGDVKVVRMMDKKLENGYSNVISAQINKSGELNTTKANIVSKEEFENLQKYINKIIKDISREILNGNIDIKPYYKNKKTPCEYCNYKTICGFNPRMCNNEYNYINKKKKEEIMEYIKGD